MSAVIYPVEAAERLTAIAQRVQAMPGPYFWLGVWVEQCAAEIVLGRRPLGHPAAHFPLLAELDLWGEVGELLHAVGFAADDQPPAPFNKPPSRTS